MLKKTVDNEQGLSLIEVVASIIILTIILLSFFTFFINTAKTTKTSETMFDATYYAQLEMEKLYNITKTPLSLLELSTPERELAIDHNLESLGYQEDASQSATFLKFGEGDINFDYQLKYSDQINGRSLTQFTILVCEKGKACSGSAIKAQMTNIYEWRGVVN